MDIVIRIAYILGSLSLFIYGMKSMSDGIKRLAGDRLRNILSFMSSNPYRGVFTGIFITAIVQSSSATTVMIVSFVNAGLISLTQSLSVIMGANIGTTFTAWIITLFGFKVKIAYFSLPIIAIGVPMLFSSSQKLIFWGEFIIGFALLFMGLDELKDSVPELNVFQLEFLKNYTSNGYVSIIIFVIIGTLLTIIMQSSSASMALTLVLCIQGVISFPIAASMVLGENIGTTITANIASLVGNNASKRAARAHLLFNCFGVLWMIALLPYYIKLIDFGMMHLFDKSPISEYSNNEYSSVPLAISIFHTSFNCINTLLLIGFIPYIVKITAKIVPDNKEEKILNDFAGMDKLVNNPFTEGSLLETKNLIAQFSRIIKIMSLESQDVVNQVSKKLRKKGIHKVEEYEDYTDKIKINITNYLSKASRSTLTTKSSNAIIIILSIVIDMERIGDLFRNMVLLLNKKYDEKLWFSKYQKKKIDSIFKELHIAIDVMISNLEGDYDKVDLQKAEKMENTINSVYKKLHREYLDRIQIESCDFKIYMAYHDVFSICERVGDYVLKVTRTIDENNK